MLNDGKLQRLLTVVLLLPVLHTFIKLKKAYCSLLGFKANKDLDFYSTVAVVPTDSSRHHVTT